MADKINILVVEDEQALLEAIRIKLEQSGFAVVSARTVEQAYSFLLDIKDIRAVWLDHYLLGQENGLDLVAKIKNKEEFKKIPVFVVSNTASPDKVKTYLNLGASKYYTKSNYRLEEIIKDLKNYLKNPE